MTICINIGMTKETSKLSIASKEFGSEDII